ncbi:MAG: PH domain-containing protein [Patescibacteria group bacterium]
MTIHKHWFVFFGRMLSLLFMGSVPFFGFLLAPELALAINPESLWFLLLFFAMIWWLVLLFIFFVEWLDYWLDAWIITDQRIIDIEQKSLFRREVSEFVIARIQDIKIETPGFIGTVLKFGNIRIQTAGEESFTIEAIPRLNETKNLIMSFAHRGALSDPD